MKKQYFTQQDSQPKVIYPGSQEGKTIQEVPRIVLRAIAENYTWKLSDMILAQEELRRRCNQKGKEGEPMD